MPAARLCSMAATMRSRWKAWRAERWPPALAATAPSRCTSKSPSSCAAKSSSRSFRARWVARSMALRVSLSILAHPLLNDDLLAGADEARALFAHAVERCLELLLGLDAAREVAADAHGDDALTVDDAPQLGDGRAQASLAGVAIRAELRDRHMLRATLLPPLEGVGQAALLILVDLRPARRLDELLERLGVRGDAGIERLV